jgi:hypothetical protein
MLKLGKLRTIVGGAFAAALVIALAPATSPSAGATTPTPYYLALGDSLSQGVQPNSAGVSVETDHGYANDLYSLYRYEVPGLQLAKLGCPGETTTTMINGGICSYSPFRSQLAAAVAFLGTHHVVLVTIDIGANNVDGCVSGGSVSLPCIFGGICCGRNRLADDPGRASGGRTSR